MTNKTWLKLATLQAACFPWFKGVFYIIRAL
jgi:hypothetical protein